jgi:acetylornithine deacetylase
MNISEALKSEETATLDLLARLVEQPSVEGNDAAIHRCLALVREAVEPSAIEVHTPVHDGLPALVARFGPRSAQQRLTFAGPIDVVPAEGDWSSDPFRLTRRGDVLFGRGVTDM